VTDTLVKTTCRKCKQMQAQMIWEEEDMNREARSFSRSKRADTKAKRLERVNHHKSLLFDKRAEYAAHLREDHNDA
jgi:hypothetical protein